MRRVLISAFLFWAVSLSMLGSGAFAHGVLLSVRVEGDAVFVDCRYPDGKKVVRSKIRVVDARGGEVLKGQTDEEGHFSFRFPAREECTVVLDDGMGHRAESRIEASRFGPAHLPAPAAVTPDIVQAMEAALDLKLAPIHARLSECREQGPGVRDVLGGLGYIVGMLGIAAYFRRRPESR